jgi:hypothetical protein
MRSGNRVASLIGRQLCDPSRKVADGTKRVSIGWGRQRFEHLAKSYVILLRLGTGLARVSALAPPAQRRIDHFVMANTSARTPSP